jgi:competence protein ComEC
MSNFTATTNATILMINLHKYPFVRLVVPYASGIWIAQSYQTDIPWEWLSAVVFAGVVLMFLIALIYRNTRLGVFYGTVLSLMLIASGMMNVQAYRPQSIPEHIINDTTSAVFFKARVSENPERKEKTTRLVLSLQSIADSNSMKPLKGLVLAYINNEDEVEIPAYGDIIVFGKRPENPAKTLNPAQFDYPAYLAGKGIFHQVFLRKGDWQFTEKGFANPLFVASFYMRDKLLQAMSENGLSGNEFHVASAILLGYDDHLPAFLRKSYTAAGAMHVLCVSGLHVGLIFMIFSYLLGFLDLMSRTRIIKTIFLFVIIWFYALITGLSPSVLRATIMISFILIGKILMRKGFLINSLAASAFLLLNIDPFTLYHIGFQLSYSAVLGIVLLQKPIYNLIHLKHKIPNTIWEVTTVAIAAQMATTPFVLHYFHQFPTYFMLSNLLLVPLSFAIILMGMGLLLTSFLPFLPWLFGKITSSMIFVMNYFIIWIEQLPNSVLHGLYITQTESFILIVALIFLVQMFDIGFRKLFLPVLLLLTLFFSSVTMRNIELQQQSKMIVYGLNRFTAIDFINGKEHIMLADSNLMKDAFMLGFNLEKFWSQYGLSNPPQWFSKDDTIKHHFINKKQQLISFNGKTIALWEKDSKRKISPQQKHKVNYVLITGNVSQNMPELRRFYEFDTLILDLSLPVWNADKWKARALADTINLYDIRENGAFIVRF